MQTQDNSLSSSKHDAVAFYAQNSVTEAVESLLNTMYVDKPEDVYGYMVTSLLIALDELSMLCFILV